VASIPKEIAVYYSSRSASYNITSLVSVASIPKEIAEFVPNFRTTINCLTLKQRSICTLYLRYITEEEMGADG
jgi:hypothetical protein